MKLSLNDSKQLFLVLLLLMGSAMFIILHDIIVPKKKIVEFIVMSLLFLLYFPYYIRKMIETKQIVPLCYTLLLSGIVALVGGSLVICTYTKVGEFLILISGMTNVGVIAYLLFKMVCRRPIGKRNEEDASWKHVMYSIPIWFFPFYINSIV
ncbi:MAG: hypothetical protein II928_04180 [Paludibacteraceae bacterium]|nr:hypothetical protein [Paludibacteraceae bacterium]